MRTLTVGVRLGDFRVRLWNGALFGCCFDHDCGVRGLQTTLFDHAMNLTVCAQGLAQVACQGQQPCDMPAVENEVLARVWGKL